MALAVLFAMAASAVEGGTADAPGAKSLTDKAIYEQIGGKWLIEDHRMRCASVDREKPGARALAITGENIGPTHQATSVTFPPNCASGQAGLVFGFTAVSYHMYVYDIGDQAEKLCRVDRATGQAVVLWQAKKTLVANIAYDMKLEAKRRSLPGLGYTFEEGYPTGKVGLVSSAQDAAFGYLKVWDAGAWVNTAGRWMNFSDDTTMVNFEGKGRLRLGGTFEHAPILAQNLRTDAFRVEFEVRRDTEAPASFCFAFNAKDQDEYDFVRIHHDAGKTAPGGFRFVDGRAADAVAGRAGGKLPACGPKDALWVRVELNAESVLTVRAAATKEGLNAAAPCYASERFKRSGGFLGFAGGGGHIYIGSFSVTTLN